MQKALWLLVIAATVVQGALAGTVEPPQRIIPCSEIIRFTAFPYLGSYQKRDRYRLVLDSVSVAPAYIPAYRTLERPWRYFAKRGLIVKRGTAVTITVPPAWRKSMAITWGNGGHGPFHKIRTAACRFGAPERGYAYAGGFYLRRSSACAPLNFTIGNRSKTMWFGIGTHCR